MGAPALPAGLGQALRDSRHTLVLTGSGISAESGVPTFREARSGLWARYDPQELATPDAFARDPALVWRWYRWRRELCRRAEPNAGHRSLAALAARLPRLTLVTQNVDGLHQRAGSPDVLEYHGNLFTDLCSGGCGAPAAADEDADVPACAGCGAPLRPGVVWFGEAIPGAVVEAAAAAAGDCDLFLSVGTSSLVWPAAGLAEQAQQGGAQLVEVNPDTTPLSPHCDFRVAAPAGSALPELLDCVAPTA